MGSVTGRGSNWWDIEVEFDAPTIVDEETLETFINNDSVFAKKTVRFAWRHAGLIDNRNGLVWIQGVESA